MTQADDRISKFGKALWPPLEMWWIFHTDTAWVYLTGRVLYELWAHSTVDLLLFCRFYYYFFFCFHIFTKESDSKLGKGKWGASEAIMGTLYMPKQFELAEGTTPFNFFIWHLVPSICLTVCFCHSPTGLSFQSWTGQNISSRRSPFLAFLSPSFFFLPLLLISRSFHLPILHLVCISAG